MPRPRSWYVATVVLLALAPAAGCSAHGDITANSTCGDYLSTQTDARHAAAVRISTELRANGAGKPVWGTSLDAECGAAPDTKLRAYFAAQQAMKVPGESMRHTVNVGDTALVNTLAYAHGKPRRGEVVVFNAPPTWSADPTPARFIKRVIATGGDHVVCCDAQHRLMVNGRPLDEPYLDRDEATEASPDKFDITVPDGRLWVMGDDRFHSGDSREQFLRMHDIATATIPVNAMVGRVFAVIDGHNQDEIRPLTVPSSYADVPDPQR
jgi:signal peptidase I